MLAINHGCQYPIIEGVEEQTWTKHLALKLVPTFLGENRSRCVCQAQQKDHANHSFQDNIDLPWETKTLSIILIPLILLEPLIYPQRTISETPSTADAALHSTQEKNNCHRLSNFYRFFFLTVKTDCDGSIGHWWFCYKCVLVVFWQPLCSDLPFGKLLCFQAFHSFRPPPLPHPLIRMNRMWPIEMRRIQYVCCPVSGRY